MKSSASICCRKDASMVGGLGICFSFGSQLNHHKWVSARAIVIRSGDWLELEVGAALPPPSSVSPRAEIAELMTLSARSIVEPGGIVPNGNAADAACREATLRSLAACKQSVDSKAALSPPAATASMNSRTSDKAKSAPAERFMFTGIFCPVPRCSEWMSLSRYVS